MQIKTKKEVIIDSLTRESAIAYLEVLNINFNFGVGFTGDIRYFYKKDLMKDNVVMSTVEQPIKNTGISFTIKDTDYTTENEKTEKTSVSQKLDSLISNAILAQVEASGIFGLTNTDWEIVTT